MSKAAKATGGSSRADNQTLPVGVTIPADVETLPQWGAQVVWKEIYKTKRLGESAEHRADWFVPVVCPNPFDIVKCAGKRNVSVRRMSPGILSADSLARDVGAVFTGLCRHCAIVVNSRGARLSPRMPDGSEVIIPKVTGVEWKAAGLLEFNCGGCGKRQRLTYTPPVADDFAFCCPDCGYAVGVETHRNGAKILWLVYYLRHIFDPPQGEKLGKYQVPYTCASDGCNAVTLTRPDCVGGQKFEWRGLCKPHQETTPLPSKITGDVCLLPFRSVVFNSRREGNSVPVQCGLLGCGEENPFNVFSTRRKGFNGYCTSHTVEEIIVRAPRMQTDALAPAQNGNGKGGRPRKFTDAEAYTAIAALGSRLSVNQLAKALNCARITVNDWVAGQGYGALSELVEARRAAQGV